MTSLKVLLTGIGLLTIVTTCLPWFFLHYSNPSAKHLYHDNESNDYKNRNSISNNNKMESSPWRINKQKILKNLKEKQQQQSEQAQHKKDPPPSSSSLSSPSSSSIVYHFLVSSGCSPYQRWQVLTQIHSAKSVQQRGKLTWIVSGCPDTAEEGKRNQRKGDGSHDNIITKDELRRNMEDHFPQDTSDDWMIHPAIHFTPDFSNMSVYGGPYADGKKKRQFLNRNGKILRGEFGNRYHFNNKPNGLYHWAQSYINNTRKDSSKNNEAIVLIDPDFLFLRPFVIPDDIPPVAPGKPLSAAYGLGDQWLDLNRTAICGNDYGGCATLTTKEIRQHYNVGPPYIVHIQDVLRLSKRWCDLVPPIFDQYPLLYAEMYAYQAAAADLQLPHTLVRTLFTGCMTAWPKKETANATLVALSAQTYIERQHTAIKQQQQQELQHENFLNGGASSCFVPPLTPPPFLHYCRRYFYHNVNIQNGNKTSDQEPLHYFIAKRRVPNNILDCQNDTNNKDNEYLMPIPSNEEEKISDEKWTTLTACAIIRAVNYAKYSHCSSRQQKQ